LAVLQDGRRELSAVGEVARAPKDSHVEVGSEVVRFQGVPVSLVVAHRKEVGALPANKVLHELCDGDGDGHRLEEGQDDEDWVNDAAVAGLQLHAVAEDEHPNQKDHQGNGDDEDDDEDVGDRLVSWEDPVRVAQGRVLLHKEPIIRGHRKMAYHCYHPEK